MFLYHSLQLMSTASLNFVHMGFNYNIFVNNYEASGSSQHTSTMEKATKYEELLGDKVKPEEFLPRDNWDCLYQITVLPHEYVIIPCFSGDKCLKHCK